MARVKLQLYYMPLIPGFKVIAQVSPQLECAEVVQDREHFDMLIISRKKETILMALSLPCLLFREKLQLHVII
jgi:hypothetical protein